MSLSLPVIPFETPMGIRAGLFENPPQTADIGFLPRASSKVHTGGVEMVLCRSPRRLSQFPLIFCLLLSRARAVAFGNRHGAFVPGQTLRVRGAHRLPTADGNPGDQGQRHCTDGDEGSL